jgi:hypothetical protein
MAVATLKTQIALFAGHDLPRNWQQVEWIGTVGAFCAENAIDGEALQALLDDIDEQGCHRIGGGAAGAFILLRFVPVEQHAADCPFRGHREIADAPSAPATVH